ncbi:hypothetical protein GCM10027416_19600 [Okibacterium endophyticum]
MVAYGYLAYLIRVSPPYRPRELQRLSAIGEHKVDLLASLEAELDKVGPRFHQNPGLAEGFRKHSHDVRGRSIFIRLRRGPVGNPGETFDTESEESVETGQTTALLSELRAVIYVPRDSYFGFLFVERVGGRHLKDLIHSRVIRPISLSTQMGIRVEAFALTDDWRKELAGKQVLRVTEVLEQVDSGHDPSTVDDVTVRVSAEGAGLSSRGDDLKARVFDILDRRHLEYRKLAEIAPLEQRRMIWAERKKRDGSIVPQRKKAPRSAFSVSDETEWEALVAAIEAARSGSLNDDLLGELQELLPVNRDEYESRRVEVSFGTERPEKTFVVAGDRVPQLVYEFGGWLTDTELRQAWDATAEQFLRGLGVDLPSGWPLEKT